MQNYYCGKCGYTLSGSYVSTCPRCGASLRGVEQSSADQISDANKRYRGAHRSRFLPRIELTSKFMGIVIIILAVVFSLLWCLMYFRSQASLQQLLIFFFIVSIPGVALGIMVIREIKFWDIVGSFMVYSGIFTGISNLVGFLDTPTETALICGFPFALAGALLLGIRYWKNHHQK
jgi:hypothetical protein